MNGWCISILQAGQAILIQIRFKDGDTPQYKRPYLVTKVYPNNQVDLLVASSIEGKEHKLSYKTNHEIVNYNPPFKKPTFVKLDSLQRVNCSSIIFHELSGGSCLAGTELDKILQKLYN